LNKGDEMKRFIAVLIAMVLVGCADSPVDTPQLGEQSSALSKKKPISPLGRVVPEPSMVGG
jgi:hypothetical protein